jgi:hypothetical protein
MGNNTLFQSQVNELVSLIVPILSIALKFIIENHWHRRKLDDENRRTCNRSEKLSKKGKAKTESKKNKKPLFFNKGRKAVGGGIEPPRGS